jgi:hypothetical protein
VVRHETTRGRLRDLPRCRARRWKRPALSIAFASGSSEKSSFPQAEAKP